MYIDISPVTFYVFAIPLMILWVVFCFGLTTLIVKEIIEGINLYRRRR